MFVVGTGANLLQPNSYDVEQAASQAIAHDFITAFPEDYKTKIDKRRVRSPAFRG